MTVAECPLYTIEMSRKTFFNPIPSHSQYFIPIPIPNPKFSLVLFPFHSHSHWLFPFTPAAIPVLLVVSRSDNKWPVNSTLHTIDKSSKWAYTCTVNASSVSRTCRVKSNIAVCRLYDKLLCKNKGPLTVSGGLWVVNGIMWSFHSHPFPSSHSHFHSHSQ